MPRHQPVEPTRPARSGGGGAFLFTLTLLIVEFLDETVFGVREAAWPLVRDDLRLTYVEIGMLISVPGILGSLVDPLLGILGDVWNRRALVLGGGVCFACALLLVGLSGSFLLLLFALTLLSSASGALVGLSQAALMDSAPSRHEQNMARWTFAGSLGNVAGSLALAAALALGSGWRALFMSLALATVAVVALAWRFPFPLPAPSAGRKTSEGASMLRHFRSGMRDAWRALKRREVQRWLALLEFADFTWDIMRGFLALYFVDVVGVSETQAALAVIVWTVVGLPGDFLLIPLLERVRGLSYLRLSALCVLVLFPAFLLAPRVETKLVLLGVLGFVNAGWYSILKAQLYSEMRGQSGTVMAVGTASGLVAALLPLVLGRFADRYGLASMMWLLLVGPAAVFVGLLTAPRAETEEGLGRPQ
jgi:FSR family fosmidomycin resistance protein-like MFS transporter